MSSNNNLLVWHAVIHSNVHMLRAVLPVSYSDLGGSTFNSRRSKITSLKLQCQAQLLRFMCVKVNSWQPSSVIVLKECELNPSTLHPNSVPASATAVQLVDTLTGLTGKRVVFEASSCMICDFSSSPSRLHGGLVGVRRVSFRVPHRCATIQRRDASAGLPEYPQQRCVWFSFNGATKPKAQNALKYGIHTVK